MPLIIAENVTHLFGAQEVLKNVSLSLDEADRVGLVGPNGEGKTTLLRILAGLLNPTSGHIHRAHGVSVGYLPQDAPAPSGSTLHGAMLEVFAALGQMEYDLHSLAAEMASSPEDQRFVKRYGQIQERFEALGGYSYHNRIDQVLTALAFPPSMYDRPLAELSGGERTRACLATLLLKEPDILLLDEPTNHLDIDSVEWLENQLSSFNGALVVVSHDRYLLDNVTTRTWEVSSAAVNAYRGNYTTYLSQRAERYKERMRAWRRQQDYIEKTRDFIRRHLAGQRTREAQGRRTRLERFLRDEAIPRPRENPTIRLSFPPCRRSGDIVLEARDVSIGFDKAAALITVEHIGIERGDRIAVVGPNGCGKTTLLRTILAELPPLSGSLGLGANVEVGYLSQTHGRLDPDTSALDAVLGAAKNLKTERARTLLGSLLLSGDDAHKRIGDLSGGERSRVVLAQLVVQSANLLVLDEPTNHLDIPSTEIMQDALQHFDGTVLFVTHDRYLVEAVATHIWAIDSGRIACIQGGWGDYLSWRAARRETPPASPETPAPESKQARRVRRAIERKEQNRLQRLRRRHQELENAIHTAEIEIARITDEMSEASVTGHPDRVHELARLYDQASAGLETLWTEWETVGEELE